MLSVDLISLVLAVAIYLIVRTETAATIACFFLFYIGYTTYSVIFKEYGDWYDFIILQSIAFIAAFTYISKSRFRRSSDKAIIFIFLMMVVYLSGMVAEWYAGDYGIFDLFYTPFMIGCYASLFVFEIGTERLADRVVQWRANRVNKSKHNRNHKEFIIA